MYAYRKRDPKRYGKYEASVRVIKDAPSWGEECWVVGRALGSSVHRARKFRDTGVLVSDGNVWDARKMPEEAQAELARLDAAIAEANRARTEWLEGNFRSWPIVTKEDCSRVVPGTPKAEAERKAKEADKTLDPVTARREGRVAKKIAKDINRIFR